MRRMLPSLIFLPLLSALFHSHPLTACGRATPMFTSSHTFQWISLCLLSETFPKATKRNDAKEEIRDKIFTWVKLSLMLFFVSNVVTKQDHKSAVLLLSLGHQTGDTVSQESLFYGANKSWNRTYNSAVFEGQNVSACFSLKDCQFVCFRCVTLFAFPRHLGCTERKGKVTLNDSIGGWSCSWEQGVKKEDRNLGSTPPDLLLECGIRCANKRFHSKGSSGRLPRSYSAPCGVHSRIYGEKKSPVI